MVFAAGSHRIGALIKGREYYVRVDAFNEKGFTEPSGIACDHYNRYEEDIMLLADAGLNAYRFSVEWARIELLQAAGKAFQATLISVLRQGALLIPCLYLMHRFFGLTGIAAAHTVADFTAIIVASVLGLREYRKTADSSS